MTYPFCNGDVGFALILCDFTESIENCAQRRVTEKISDRRLHFIYFNGGHIWTKKRQSGKAVFIFEYVRMNVHMEMLHRL